MTKYNWLIYFWFAFLLTPFFLPVVVNASVVQNTSLPPQNPTVPAPRQAVGTIDSLQKAQSFYQEKKYKEALKISLALLKKATDEKNNESVEKTSFLIASIFKNTNNYDKALEYYKKSIAIANNSADSVHIVSVQLNIGIMYSKINSLDSASVYYNKIINRKTFQKEIEFLQARAYVNLSGVQLKRGNILQAEDNALEALYLQKKFKDNFLTAQALNNLASIYLLQNRYRDAKRELFEAMALIKTEKTARALKYKETIYDNLSWALYQLKDYRSYKYQEKSFSIRDSLRNAEIGGYLQEIEAKFNTETIKKQEQLKTAEEKAKKEHAQGINNILLIISLSLLLGAWLIYRYLKLRQKNLQLEYSQNQLIQQNKLEQIQNDTREKILNATLDAKESERKRVAETLHHNVSTLLSSASLHLQASRRLLSGTPPQEIEKAQKIINEAADRIRNLSHSLVSSVLLKFGLGYAVQDLCDKYSNASLNFYCKCDEIVRYDAEFELRINSIIDELLNNIIKHSKASNAEIKLRQKQEQLKISILDDGKGFDPKTGINEDGLGLRQIEARVRRMKGVFKINSSAFEGTSVFISVPIPHLKKPIITS